MHLTCDKTTLSQALRGLPQFGGWRPCALMPQGEDHASCAARFHNPPYPTTWAIGYLAAEDEE